jgi:hypothetical protein
MTGGLRAGHQEWRRPARCRSSHRCTSSTLANSAPGAKGCSRSSSNRRGRRWNHGIDERSSGAPAHIARNETISRPITPTHTCTPESSSSSSLGAVARLCSRCSRATNRCLPRQGISTKCLQVGPQSRSLVVSRPIRMRGNGGRWHPPALVLTDLTVCMSLRKRRGALAPNGLSCP